MIYITGDVHNSVDFDKIYRFIDRKKNEMIPLTKNDVLIVTGDFGIPWVHRKSLKEQGIDVNNYSSMFYQEKEDQQLIKYMEEQVITFLFVDGNHECHLALNDLPQVEMFGCMAGQLGKNIFHLKRGYVYNIQGKKIFTFGGAESIDKQYRTEFISWWKEEIPSMEEYDRALENLKKVNNEVDIIITHTLPYSIMPLCGISYMEDKRRDPTTMMLDNFYRDVKFDKWYCGHFHEDKEWYKFQLCYYGFYEVQGDINYETIS